VRPLFGETPKMEMYRAVIAGEHLKRRLQRSGYYEESS